MNKILIGVDFSMNSTGVCILRNGEYSFLNFPRQSKPDKKGLTSTDKFPYTEIPLDVVPFQCDKESTDYINDQRLKLNDSILLSSHIAGGISNSIVPIEKTEEVFISLEGVSFGSKGSSVLDIVGYQWILRQKLVEELCCGSLVSLENIENLFIFSPQTVKKTAGSGRLNKEGMLEKFFEVDDTVLKNTDFFKWVDNYRLGVDKKGKPNKLPKPTDDVVDAYWLVKTLERYLDEN